MPKRKVPGTEKGSAEPRESKRACSIKPHKSAPIRVPKRSKANQLKKGSNPETLGDQASKSSQATAAATTESIQPSSRQYWLLKAEPESRFEKGKDVKFSIDDLAAKTEPEPWDGIRSYASRNNLRAMKKGDLGFFYHSSCKEPGIVGIMEIVAEHTPDFTAHDPSAAYYDPKDQVAQPRWSVVHVEFRQKLKQPISLRELKAWYITKGHVLQGLQVLRQARLSVSRVEEREWEFLLKEMRRRGDEVRF